MVRRGHSNAEYLFHEYDFHAVQENQRQRMIDAIQQAPGERIRSEDTTALVDAFVAEFQIDIPELTEGAVSVTVDEAQVDATGDFNRAFFGPGPHFVPGIRATYFVPFRGDRDLFKCKPSTWTTVIPAAELADTELRFTFERADENVGATKLAFEQELGRVKQYLGWLRENASTFNQSLPGVAREQITSRKARLEQVDHGVQSLGVPIRLASVASKLHRPSISEGHGHKSERTKTYEVALSFAGEDRAYVEEVARGLKEAGVTVFYDAFEKADLWGKNLIDHLAEIYQKRSKYVVMFISAKYVEKAWTKHERTHAQARALVAKEEYILPARFDDTEVPGMTSTVGHVDLQKTEPAQLVELILEKLGKKR
jgi:hypothetical protein